MSELPWREARAAGAAGVTLLPIGSQEQHAAHLPLGTDALLVEAVVDRARPPPGGPRGGGGPARGGGGR
ncbi:creatininase family protein, partial [Streptomyces sp. 8L]|uniref:creatininase family protein n=1 Tax=Streptomyces sp. 8L TaxID=2877242 RepID=UPI0021E5E0E4